MTCGGVAYTLRTKLSSSFILAWPWYLLKSTFALFFDPFLINFHCPPLNSIPPPVEVSLLSWNLVVKIMILVMVLVNFGTLWVVLSKKVFLVMQFMRTKILIVELQLCFCWRLDIFLRVLNTRIHFSSVSLVFPSTLWYWITCWIFFRFFLN
jgi:hypothetical protein